MLCYPFFLLKEIALFWEKNQEKRGKQDYIKVKGNHVKTLYQESLNKAIVKQNKTSLQLYKLKFHIAISTFYGKKR